MSVDVWEVVASEIVTRLHEHGVPVRVIGGDAGRPILNAEFGVHSLAFFVCQDWTFGVVHHTRTKHGVDKVQVTFELAQSNSVDDLIEYVRGVYDTAKARARGRWVETTQAGGRRPDRLPRHPLRSGLGSK